MIRIWHTVGPGHLGAAYAHNCSEWDDLFIDETCDEFAACSCFEPTPEFLALQDAIAVRLDAKRGPI